MNTEMNVCGYCNSKNTGLIRRHGKTSGGLIHGDLCLVCDDCGTLEPYRGNEEELYEGNWIKNGVQIKIWRDDDEDEDEDEDEGDTDDEDEEVCEECGCCLIDKHYNDVYGNMVCDDCFDE